jgi:hypothetical protein
VDYFTMLAEIETFSFGVTVDPNTDGFIDHKYNDGGCDRAPNNGGSNAIKLSADLSEIAFQGTGGSADRFDRKDACQDRTGDATKSVNGEDIKTVIIAELMFQ